MGATKTGHQVLLFRFHVRQEARFELSPESIDLVSSVRLECEHQTLKEAVELTMIGEKARANRGPARVVVHPAHVVMHAACVVVHTTPCSKGRAPSVRASFFREQRHY